MLCRAWPRHNKDWIRGCFNRAFKGAHFAVFENRWSECALDPCEYHRCDRRENEQKREDGPNVARNPRWCFRKVSDVKFIHVDAPETEILDGSTRVPGA